MAIESIDLDKLDYGCYSIDVNGSFTEALTVNSADWNRLYSTRVRMPAGKKNIVYMVSDTFENSFSLLKGGKILFPPNYRKVYYPQVTTGYVLGRRYRLNLSKERKNRTELIRSNTKMSPYSTRTISPNESSNVVFIASDILAEATRIAARFPVKKLVSEFFADFDAALVSITPEYTADGEKPNGQSGNRIMLIDAERFAFKANGTLTENKTNPLFLLYLSFLRSRDQSIVRVDRDIVVASHNLLMKINPTKMPREKLGVFKNGLFRIMGTNLDEYTSSLPQDEQNQLDVTQEDIKLQKRIEDAVAPYTKYNSGEMKKVVKSIATNVVGKKVEDRKKSAKKMTEPLELGKVKKKAVRDEEDPDLDSLFADLEDEEDTEPEDDLLTDDEEDDSLVPDKDVNDTSQEDIEEIIRNDEELADEISNEVQDRVAPMKDLTNAPVNSARDMKLREAQQKIMVRNSTIGEILERDSSNIPVEVEDTSDAMTTTNPNMKSIKFANFEKSYIENLYERDIVSMFDCLKDKSTPFYITDIDIKDTSDAANLRETWTVTLVDENGKKHRIKVNVPKFYQNRFMRIRGNKYVILKQNFYNPLVKDSEDQVIVTTNRKIFINRKSVRSFSDIDRLFSLIRKVQDDRMFITGTAIETSKGNVDFVSTLEYDEIGRQLFRFKSDTCEINFSRTYIRDNDPFDDQKNENEFYIGRENGKPILINEDTGRDRNGRTIVDIIVDNLPEDYRREFNKIKPRKESMYAQATLLGKAIPIGVVLVVWDGITEMLNRMEIGWSFIPGAKRIPTGDSTKAYIRFADGILEYDSMPFSQLILNGLAKLNPSEYAFEDLNSEKGYVEYLHRITGTYSYLPQLMAFKEFLIDPITLGVCRDLLLPTEPDLLLMQAVRLLCDNRHKSKASDTFYRIRSVEIIPMMLYEALRVAYENHVKSGRTRPLSIAEDTIFSMLLKQKTVEEYSTLNPATEVSKMHTISTMGYIGSNSSNSYDEAKRSYDETSIGKLAMSTPPDKGVGVTRELVVEPTITNVRGYREPVDDLEKLQDVNIFSPVEMLTPGTAAGDDAIRVAIANKQTKHLVPVKDAQPSLVSNGFDEALQFHLSNDFVVNAEEDGKVIEFDENTGLVVVEYKSGKHQAFNVKPEVVKNSAGGFYVSNTLTTTVKLGDKFKKNQVLAYHSRFFRYSKVNGLRYAIGPLVKVAFMSSYNTYEDAGICTKKMADQIRTAIVFREDAAFTKNTNIFRMAKVGDRVMVGDTLIQYEEITDDSEITRMINLLGSEENKQMLSEESRNNIRAHHAGTIVDIKVYSLQDPSNLAPSLGEIVQKYFDQGNAKKNLLEKYDNSPGIIKAGYLLTDSTQPEVSKYHELRGYRDVDVVIEFYIEQESVAGVGDKIALYGANKQIISEVIPEGYEPYSEFHPEEEISVLTSPGTIARRMTSSILSIAMGMKCMVELKRRVKELVEENNKNTK